MIGEQSGPEKEEKVLLNTCGEYTDVIRRRSGYLEDVGVAACLAADSLMGRTVPIRF